MKTYKNKIICKQKGMNTKQAEELLDSYGNKGYKIAAVISKEKSITYFLTKETKPTKNKEDINPELNKMIELWNWNSPAYKRFFSNTNQRKALQDLIKEHGEEKIEMYIRRAGECQGKDKAPRITTPCHLRDKWLMLETWIKANPERKKCQKCPNEILKILERNLCSQCIEDLKRNEEKKLTPEQRQETMKKWEELKEKVGKVIEDKKI